MREIMTVLGPIVPDKLGFCQCHEHILLNKGRSSELNPALCIDNVPLSLDELIRYKSAGGDSLIDAQPGGCSRMPEELAYISGKSHVNIIASTGFHKLLFYPKNHWIHTASENMLTEFFTGELLIGMYTNIDNNFTESRCPHHAGIIKTALDTEGLSPGYQRLFKAAASAANATDKNIMVHVEQGINPAGLLDFLLAQEVNPARIIFCHMDRACMDIQSHLNILKYGCYLEYDTIGRFKYHSDNYEAGLILRLIHEGYEKQLLYSLDTTRTRLKAYDSSAIGLDYILTTFNQTLLNAGITKRQIHSISVENCVQALTH